MIFDSFNSPLNQLKYPKVLAETIENLKKIDFKNLQLGRHEIQGKDIFFNLSEYETFNVEERIIEAHKEYVDIQFLVEGTEKIGYSTYDDKNVIKEEYSSEKDLLVYEKIENEFFLTLIPGVFAIFFTEEPHRPSCVNENSEKVRKIVVKIKKELLK